MDTPASEQLFIGSERGEILQHPREKKRFKFFIETATGCFGDCPGCAFTDTERSHTKPLIEEHLIPLLFKRLKELVDPSHPSSLIDEQDTIIINFGAADHLLYETHYLDVLFGEASKFFKEVGTKRNISSFSTSGLMNPEKMLEKIETMKKHFQGEKFAVNFVVDLARFKRLEDRYQASLDMLLKHTRYVDLGVNLESYSDERDWDAFISFANRNPILNVNIAYPLNRNNAHRVSLEAGKIFSIYQRMSMSVQAGYSLIDTQRSFSNPFSDPLPGTTDLLDISLAEACQLGAESILSNALFIRSDLMVFPVMFIVFTDIPLNDRLGQQSIGHLFDPDLNVKIAAHKNILADNLANIFSHSRQCHDCEIVNHCYHTGAPLLNPQLNTFHGVPVKRAAECQNPARPFILEQTGKWHSRQNPT